MNWKILLMGVLLHAQTIIWSENFNSGSSLTPTQTNYTGSGGTWELNSSELGGASGIPADGNFWVVNDAYGNATNVEMAPCTVYVLGIPVYPGTICSSFGPSPTQPTGPTGPTGTGIVGAPESGYLHITYDWHVVNSGACATANLSAVFADPTDPAPDSPYPCIQAATHTVVSPSFSTTGHTGVTLTFWTQNGSPAGSGDAKVYYRTSATGTWTQIATVQSVSSWQKVDITNPALDNQSYLQLAFTFETFKLPPGTSAPAEPAFSIDDIYVWKPSSTTPTIDITAANLDTVCVGASLNVAFTTSGTVTPPFTAELSDAAGSFASPAPIGSGATSPISVTIPTNTTTGNYKVRIVDNSTPAVISDTVDIWVINPQITCPGDQTVTAGSSTSVNIGWGPTWDGPATIEWDYTDDGTFDGSASVSSSPYSLTLSYATAGTYTCRVRVTTRHGCQQECTFQVTVVPPSPSEIDITPASLGSRCVGASFDIAFTTSGTVNPPFTVQLSDGTGSFAAPTPIGTGNASPISVTVPTIASGNYRVRIVDRSVPAVISDTVDLTIVSPSITCPGSQNLVVGQSTSVSIIWAPTSDGPARIEWDYENDGNFDGSDPNVPSSPYNLTLLYNTPGSYTCLVKVTTASGCEVTCTFSVDVASEGITLQRLTPNRLCTGESFDADYTSTNLTFGVGNVFTLNVIDAGGNVVHTCSASSTSTSGTLNCTIPSTPNAITPGVYTVQLTSSSPAKQSNTLVLEVVATPVAAFDPAAQVRYCLGQPIEFKDFSEGADSVRWVWGDGDSQVTAAGATVSHTYNAAGTYTVRLIAYATATCTSEVSRDYTILPLPQAGFVITSDTVLTLPNENILTVQNTSVGASDYEWDFGNGQTSTAMDPGPITYESVGRYTITLVAISSDGCRDTAQRSILVREGQELIIPTAFTPNGDGINDDFVVRYAGFQKINLVIYNRWGQKLYDERSNATTGVLRWRPDSNLPEGAYVYYIQGTLINGKELVRSGTLTLLR